jgi:two-component system nitrogen regulation response regulator GlnG
VIFITGLSGSETAIEAMKLGAYDYLLKPLDMPKLRELVERALEIRRLMNVPVELPREEAGAQAGDQLIGRSLVMQEVYKAIGRVAPQNVPVLIHGESGTGKKLVARAIYHHSRRADQRFLAVNCAAIPAGELESELFGNEKSAASGAEQRRIGKFEQCSGGTIFLDEVDGMSPLVQNKVLRFLQDHEFERVGGSEKIRADVRVLAATNRDLKKMVADGSFREDLYYRLHGFTIEVPPLRERNGDLPLLIQHNLTRLNRDSGRNVHAVAPESLELLTRYPWPGNVRELETVIHQALVRTNGTVILPEFLPESIQDYNGAEPLAIPSDDPSCDLQHWVDHCLQNRSQDTYSEIMDMTERYLLTRVLRATDGNQSQAAKLLGITRGSLRSKIRSLGINLRAAVTIDGAAVTSNGYDGDAI